MATSNHLLPSCFAFLGVSIIYFFVKPLVEYFYDAKSLRQYPNQNIFSGFTNLGLVYERLAPFRTANLYNAHKKDPIIRTGPSSLSFRDVRAIKDIYGHSSAFFKDDMYIALQGSHANMINVVDKNHHAKKRKLLSNAFATRNLLSWEYKVIDKVERLMRQFDDAQDSVETAGMDWAVLDFQLWFNLFTVEAIMDVALSYKTGMIEAGNDLITIKLKDGQLAEYPFIKCLHAQGRPTSLLVWPTTWYPALRKLMGLASSWFRSQYRDGAHFGEIVHHLTQDRIDRHQQSEKFDDLFQSLMEDRHGSPNELDLGEIEAEVSAIGN